MISTNPRQLDDQDAAVRLAIQLIAHHGVTESDLLRVMSLQRDEQISFADAVRRLGLMPAEEMLAPAPIAPEDHIAARPLPSLVPPPGKAPPGPTRIRALRAEILLRQAQTLTNVFAVVAAGPDDGAADLAADLAVSFAQLEDPTLLIDADLRERGQLQRFQLGPRPGLAELLAGETATTGYSGVHGLPHLTVLPAGARPSNPQELLASSAFGRLLQGWRTQFRHIVVSTSAASGSSDGLIIAASIGCALAVARVDTTSLDDFNELQRHLKAASVRVLGGVLYGQGRS